MGRSFLIRARNHEFTTRPVFVIIVHRLTNDRNREGVEPACGEIDRAVSSFYPNLKQGEAVILGANFSILLTIKINRPKEKPKSDGPDYQKC